MGKFFISGETVRVNFPDGEWVDVKEEFSQADIDFITTKMMQGRLSVDGKEKPEAEVGLTFGRAATLERAIVAWSFADDGKPVPVTAGNISNLRNKYRTILLQEIDRLSSKAGAFAKN